MSEKIDESPHRVWDREALESWLALDNYDLSSSKPPTPAPRQSIENGNEPVSFLNMGKEHQARCMQSSVSYNQNLRRSLPLREESWQRFEVTDGLEVNVRSDIVKRYRQQIMQLVEELKRSIR
ncbi:MAG TPA: hypothetical protein PK036_06655 [Geobacteraceae bacterium]|nr:hypothetical protein [Geobacteraceae bacterium]